MNNTRNNTDNKRHWSEDSIMEPVSAALDLVQERTDLTAGASPIVESVALSEADEEVKYMQGVQIVSIETKKNSVSPIKQRLEKARDGTLRGELENKKESEEKKSTTQMLGKSLGGRRATLTRKKITEAPRDPKGETTVGAAAYSPTSSPTDNSVGGQIKKQLDMIRQGKYIEGQGKPPRKGSAISVVLADNQFENARNKSLLLQTHPLLDEDPNTWNNIPQCVAKAITKIMTCLCEKDESLYDYQMQNNNRLFKLQDQVSALKGGLRDCEIRLERSFAARFKHESEVNEANVQHCEQMTRNNELNLKEMQAALQMNTDQIVATSQVVEEFDRKIEVLKHVVSQEQQTAQAKLAQQIKLMQQQLQTTLNQKLTVQTAMKKNIDLKDFLLDRIDELEPRFKRKMEKLDKKINEVNDSVANNIHGISGLKDKHEAVGEVLRQMEQDRKISMDEYEEYVREQQDVINDIKDSIESQAFNAPPVISPLPVAPTATISAGEGAEDGEIGGTSAAYVDQKLHDLGTMMRGQFDKKIKMLKEQVKDVDNKLKALQRQVIGQQNQIASAPRARTRRPSGQQSLPGSGKSLTGTKSPVQSLVVASEARVCEAPDLSEVKSDQRTVTQYVMIPQEPEGQSEKEEQDDDYINLLIKKEFQNLSKPINEDLNMIKETFAKNDEIKEMKEAALAIDTNHKMSFVSIGVQMLAMKNELKVLNFKLSQEIRKKKEDVPHAAAYADFQKAIVKDEKSSQMADLSTKRNDIISEIIQDSVNFSSIDRSIDVSLESSRVQRAQTTNRSPRINPTKNQIIKEKIEIAEGLRRSLQVETTNNASKGTELRSVLRSVNKSYDQNQKFRYPYTNKLNPNNHILNTAYNGKTTVAVMQRGHTSSPKKNVVGNPHATMNATLKGSSIYQILAEENQQFINNRNSIVVDSLTNQNMISNWQTEKRGSEQSESRFAMRQVRTQRGGQQERARNLVTETDSNGEFPNLTARLVGINGERRLKQPKINMQSQFKPKAWFEQLDGF